MLKSFVAKIYASIVARRVYAWARRPFDTQESVFNELIQKATKTKKPIYVTDIRPGFVDTDMAKGEGQCWVAPKEKAARQIVGIIKKKKGIGYVTKRWWIIAKLLRLIPNGLYKKI